MTEIVASKPCTLLFQPCISVSTAMAFHGVARARRFSWPGVSGSIMLSLKVIGVWGSLTTSRCIVSSRVAIRRLVVLSVCISVCCCCFWGVFRGLPLFFYALIQRQSLTQASGYRRLRISVYALIRFSATRCTSLVPFRCKNALLDRCRHLSGCFSLLLSSESCF